MSSQLGGQSRHNTKQSASATAFTLLLAFFAKALGNTNADPTNPGARSRITSRLFISNGKIVSSGEEEACTNLKAKEKERRNTDIIFPPSFFLLLMGRQVDPCFVPLTSLSCQDPTAASIGRTHRVIEVSLFFILVFGVRLLLFTPDRFLKASAFTEDFELYNSP